MLLTKPLLELVAGHALFGDSHHYLHLAALKVALTPYLYGLAHMLEFSHHYLHLAALKVPNTPYLSERERARERHREGEGEREEERERERERERGRGRERERFARYKNKEISVHIKECIDF